MEVCSPSGVLTNKSTFIYLKLIYISLKIFKLRQFYFPRIIDCFWLYFVKEIKNAHRLSTLVQYMEKQTAGGFQLINLQEIRIIKLFTFNVVHALQDALSVQVLLHGKGVGPDIKVAKQVEDPLNGKVAVALRFVVFVEQQRAPPGEVLEHRHEGLCHLLVGRSDARQVRELSLFGVEAEGQSTCRDDGDVPVRRQPDHRRRLVLAHRPQDQVWLVAARPVHQLQHRPVDTVGVLKVDVEVEAGVRSGVCSESPLCVKDRRSDSGAWKQIGVVLGQKHQHVYVFSGAAAAASHRRDKERQKVQAQCAEVCHACAFTTSSYYWEAAWREVLLLLLLLTTEVRSLDKAAHAVTRMAGW